MDDGAYYFASIPPCHITSPGRDQNDPLESQTPGTDWAFTWAAVSNSSCTPLVETAAGETAIELQLTIYDLSLRTLNIEFDSTVADFAFCEDSISRTSTLENLNNSDQGEQGQELFRPIKPREVPSLRLPEQPRRRRKESTKREQGNNRFGRQGNLRCAECRKRNSKCVYKSPWLPCDFCTMRNKKTTCIKIPGPKTSTRLRISRPSATASESTPLAPEDVLLLQYLYSQNGSIMAALIKCFAVTYGIEIRPSALRHALLMKAAGELPCELFGDKFEKEKMEVWHELRNRLDMPNTMDAADVFSVYILSYSNFGIRHNESAIHTKGCESLLAFWRENPSMKPQSEILEAFEPLLLNWIDFFHGFCDFKVPDQPITFSENLKSFARLRHTGTPSDVWKSPHLTTTHDYLGYILTMSLSWLQVVACNEQTPGFERESVVRPMAQHLRTALGDSNFQAAIGDLEAELVLGEANDPHIQLITYQFIQLRTLRIVLAVLEGTSTLQALTTPEVSIGATNLALWLKSEERTSWGFWEYSEEDYPRLLTLAGLGLPPSACENSRNLEEWIRLTLEGLGLQNLAHALDWWSRLRSIDAFAGVLNALWSSWRTASDF